MATGFYNRTLKDTACDKCGGSGKVSQTGHDKSASATCPECNGLGVKATHRSLLTK